MSDRKAYLRSILSGESRAYGFTIAFWGSGALLINAFGAPDIVLALCFGFGAVLGFGMLALTTLRGDGAPSDEDTLLVLSTIHYLSALGPIVFTHLMINLEIETWMTFLLSGISVSLLHNLLSIVEHDIAKLVNRL